MKTHAQKALELVEESRYAGTHEDAMLLAAQAQVYATLALAAVTADRGA